MNILFLDYPKEVLGNIYVYKLLNITKHWGCSLYVDFPIRNSKLEKNSYLE